MRILTVFGTRPEAIKMAPVIKELKSQQTIECVTCSTGQHREMLDQVLHLFDIKPDHELDVMKPDQTPMQVAAAILNEIDSVIRNGRFDWVLVQGDTTTVAASSIAAFYNRVRVGHVEAGLRTGDKWQPFPEEINRRIAGVVADLHFAPTETARNNLIAENVPPENIVVTGNTVIDALLWIARSKPSESTAEFLRSLNLADNERIILVTAHRRENHGEGIRNICRGLLSLANKYRGQIRIIYPVHMNPNIDIPVRQALSNVPGITLLPPIGYEELVHLMRKSYLILTDSGGIQEEAPALGIPVLVLRNTTERPEGIQAGTAKLIGTDVEKIITETSRLLDNPSERDKISRIVNPYGDGKAAERIVRAILDKADTSGA